MLQVKKLIQKFGRKQARQYLLEYFNRPENLVYFPSLFPDHIGVKLPPFQQEILQLTPKHAKLAFTAPRGAGKSTLVNIPLMAWFALFAKSHFTILISATLPQARLHLEALAYELENNPYIRWLFGDVRGKVWGADMIVVRTRFGESAIVAKGAGQKIRGLKFRSYRPELAVLDDLEDDQSVGSAEQREKLERWFRFNLLRGLSKHNSKVVYIGTILHEKALLRRIMQQKDPLFKGWEVRNNKAILDNGLSFWEDQFPLDWLISIRDDPTHPDYAGSLVFAQEYQNEPRSAKDRIIQPEWMQEYSGFEKDDAWRKSLKVVGAVDPAISTKKGSSFFAFHTIGVDENGHKWHLDTIRGKFSALDQAQMIVQSFLKWRHRTIGIEAIAYQEALVQLVKAEAGRFNAYPNIKRIHTRQDKSSRMVGVSPQFQGGFVHLLREHEETPNLKTELLEFPAEPNDSADAFALALEVDTKKKSRGFARKPAGL